MEGKEEFVGWCDWLVKDGVFSEEMKLGTGGYTGKIPEKAGVALKKKKKIKYFNRANEKDKLQSSFGQDKCHELL